MEENKNNIIGKIDWDKRIGNKHFWINAIPATLLLFQVIGNVFGFQLDLGEIGNKLLEVVNALFMVLSLLGIAVDPTTPGIGDEIVLVTEDK